MKKKLNVLVIGVSGNVSIGILKVLKDSNLGDLYTYGACINKYSAGFGLSDEALICPLAFSNEFPAWLSRIENELKIDLVISGVSEVNHSLSRIKKQQNCAVYLCPEFDYLKIFNDKLETVNWLNTHRIEHPKTLDLGKPYQTQYIIEHLGLPFIIKPKIGKSSQGVRIINNEHDLHCLDNKNGYIAQQIIGTPETEFTCGVYKSRFGYTRIIVLRRELSNGTTRMAEVVSNEEIEQYCARIAECIDTTAPFNIQLRLCEKTQMPYCFEINMRLSGTTSIRHNFGFKDCEAWIREQIFNLDSRDLFNVVPGIAIRYEEEHFFSKHSLDKVNEIKPVRLSKSGVK